MKISIIIPLILAVVVPFIYGFANIFDKYVLSHKVKNPLGFAVVAGIINVLFGIILSLFLDWSNINYNDFIFPGLAGLLIGIQYFFYYFAIKNEDASNISGLIYFYPIIVAFLSFFFLNEILPIISYMGLVLILTGVLIISLRMKKLKFRIGVWMIISMILIIGLYEFLIKISTTRLPEFNGIAINCITVGFVMLLSLSDNRIRRGLVLEIKNINWAFFSEAIYILGMIALYFAMAGLPATLVASIATIQPMVVLIFERIADKLIGNMKRDHLLLPKLIPLTLIIIGVILLYLPELMKLMPSE